MNYFKNCFYLLATILLIGSSSCSDDEDCVAPVVEENIIGTWDTTVSNNQVAFNADGTYVDEDEVLFGIGMNGVDEYQKTYAISGNTLTLTLTAPDSSTSSVDYEVGLNECDRIIITVDNQGTSFEERLTR